MQGLLKIRPLLFLLFPVLAACISPRSSEIDGRLQRVQEVDEVEQVQEPVLPIALRSRAEIPMIDNCAVGCPSGGGETTIVRDAYTLNNNGSTKFANWVAYKITKDTPAPNRPRNWKTDPDLPADETLNPVDYNGAHVALALDRGHQANLASMGGITEWQPLNYLSNITPQKEDLNRGAWARLEDKERNLGKTSVSDAVYVATGPLYERTIGSLPGTNKVHTIPSGYWKVIFLGSSPANGMFAAFIMDQNTPRTANFCDYQVTVAEIEERSGLTLWSDLPDDVQSALKSKRGKLPRRIGCTSGVLQPLR
ncbi:DNA/RNA non-specific endonuclease [Pseudomonas koreensis]|uniref:DNA/RNA non-specific endonuclease n=1 Tax=Pseudomonas koreensis TaxID=198620 RepID=UPI001B3385BB|nr:DNA/RNA non-specific endonuclease [Pseudomonas koreensis]MBP4002427.1 DNA/RNA non-specific endonuclease [Pseudomonas koreensis]